MFEQTINPVDTCGCGDTGYLTTRKVPIDLAHGVGYIENVPVYQCRSKSCSEFTLPPEVSRRLEDIAEQMEADCSTIAVYTWKSNQPDTNQPIQQSYQQMQAEAFTLQFIGREYADAHVAFVVPGQAIFFQSTIEDSEYFLLRYETNPSSEGIWFDFLKFYYNEPNLTYEGFVKWSEDGYLKELGSITLEEVEDTLLDEFGEIIQ
ncbi:hypothetical protein Desaci_3224 [Desulfosporosinus acidiphilus SJ4]|uniref:Uncharacterized protein n=1 Tax=Desulfosporosinus acidiphilus (strain DSM 22704 / JCM 16185 / SJ4) TaxID=646529 RepID=I4D8K1_DESAJ|nr:hypothetical protein [Desulfosporosinus acidiphilus]AFM42125.1 hypothetical protein Desaci_3224 [Desulfosporosinus acidiphilus SJ4]